MSDVAKTKDLVDALHEFNRKERYWVIQQAFGEQTNTTVFLSKAFRNSCNAAFNPVWGKIEIPDRAYWAFDYHLDWLFGAAARMTGKTARFFDNRDAHIRGNQQDVDFLIAFENHLLLVEAKAEGQWSREQFESKRNRILDFCQYCTTNQLDLNVYFALLSPERPEPNLVLEKRLDNLNCGRIELPHIEMGLFNKEAHHRIERCSDRGLPKKNGGFWRIV